MIKAGNTRIDLAMARSETYARPGALPKVALADIETDLRRRDFTVNAMALRLDGEAELVDPCGGVDDLGSRRIRVLHDASFRDDATRIFRAFRYASRLEFKVDPHTRSLIDEGVRYVETIGGERLRHELELLIGERAFGGLEGCGTSGALAAIHSKLCWGLKESQWLHDDSDVNVVDHTAYGFALMASGATPADAEQIALRLKLKRGETSAVAGVAALNDAASLLSRPNVKPSGAAQILERYTDPAIAAFARMRGETAAGVIAQQYLTEWKFVKPSLTARDVIEMGVPEGPRISQALQLLRAARLDGTARDLDDERTLVARFARSIRDSSSTQTPIELHTNGH
jgi:tRNA nucleotidyltransferase (CCA-adding enzyme)